MEARADLDAVRAFVAVAEHLHVGRAAEALGVARNTVAVRVSAYERQAGRTLIDRSHRRVVSLTAAGETVLPAARQLLSAAAAHDRHVSAVRTGTRGVVRVAVRPHRGPLVDFLILVLEGVDGGWGIDVQTLPPWEICHGFAYGRIDCALTPVRPPDRNTSHIDRRPRRFEQMEGFRIGPRNSGLYVTWRARWVGPHADALIGTARAVSDGLRTAAVRRRREEHRRAQDLRTAALLQDIERRWAGADRQSLSPDATGSRRGR